MRIHNWLRRKPGVIDLDALPELKEHPRLYKKLRRVSTGWEVWQICVISILLGIIFGHGLQEVISGNLRGILSMLSLPVFLTFWYGAKVSLKRHPEGTRSV